MNIIGDLVELVFKLVSTVTDSEQIAVRLKKGNDYPFYRSLGYSTNNNGTKCLVTSSEKEINYMECMCGRVITDNPSGFEDFFTKYGAFWNSNIGKDCLDNLDKAFIHERSCFTDGNKSLAIVPLKDKGRCEGVFHIADKHAGKFNDTNIKRIEEIGLYFTQIILKIEKVIGESRTRKYNILVVDDEPAIASLINNVLSRIGHLCHQAADGIEAMKIVATNKIDLIITDLSMPNMTGRELIHAVRDKYDIYGPAVVVISGYLNDLPDEFKTKYNVSSILSKPLDDIFEIQRVVDRVLCQAV